MTPERLVELLGDPKVTDKLVELMGDPRVLDRAGELLQEPALAGKLGALLKSPQIQEALSDYVDLAVTGVIVLAVLGALNLLAIIYHTVLLRRVARNSEQ